MRAGDRVQAKANGHRGTLVAATRGHSFTIRYDHTRDERGRKVRGQRITFPWHRAGAFNFGRTNPGAHDA